jgi:hypothetical protein
MKTSHISFLLLSVIALSLQSCLFPWYSTSQPQDTYKVNTVKFMAEQKLEKDQTFTTREQGIITPLLSAKGQVNWSTNFIHGINSNFAVAISNKMFLTVGGTYMHSEDNVDKTGSFEIEHGIWNENHYDYYISTANRNYNINQMIENYSFNVGAGFYKTFSKNGRWDYFAGFGHGRAITQYDYHFDNTSYPDGYSSDYTFIEERAFNQVHLQSNFGYVSRQTEGAIVARISWMHFNTQQLTNLFNYKTYEMKKDEFVFQPAMHFAYGGKFRIFTNIGWNVPLGNNQMKWFSTNVQLGVILKFKDKSLM